MSTPAHKLACASAFLVLSVVSVCADEGTQSVKLLPDDGAATDLFGRSVAMDGSVVVVGAFGAGGAGSAYVLDATTGLQVAKLLAIDGASGDSFGAAVAVSGSSTLR